MDVRLDKLLQEIWYGKHPLAIVLTPLSWCYRGFTLMRRWAYSSGLLSVTRLPVPVIVAGNVSVGGTGKTPLVIWLAGFLKANGYRPGVVTRGYGGRAETWPQQVRPDSDPLMVGDEAVVLARRCACPVAAGPNRAQAALELLAYSDCNLILCDDGLQHLALERDVEIVVIDGVRRHGNGRCLPAGPLREPVRRVQTVDIVVTNGAPFRGEFGMKYCKRPLRMVADESKQGSMQSLRGVHVHAVAATGFPERFFDSLRAEGVLVEPHPYPDHHLFRREEITFNDGLPVVMTEKDAVKCRRIAGPEHWYVPIDAELPGAFSHRLLHLLHGVKPGEL